MTIQIMPWIRQKNVSFSNTSLSPKTETASWQSCNYFFQEAISGLVTGFSRIFHLFHLIRNYKLFVYSWVPTRFAPLPFYFRPKIRSHPVKTNFSSPQSTINPLLSSVLHFFSPRRATLWEPVRAELIETCNNNWRNLPHWQRCSSSSSASPSGKCRRRRLPWGLAPGPSPGCVPSGRFPAPRTFWREKWFVKSG